MPTNGLTDFIALLVFAIPTALSAAFHNVTMGNARTSKLYFLLSGAASFAFILYWLSNSPAQDANIRLSVYIIAILLLAIFWIVSFRHVNKHCVRPNLECIDQDDLMLTLTDKQVFRIDDRFESYRALVAVIRNLPAPPRKVATLHNVTAEVFFFDPDWKENMYQQLHIHRACWVNEASDRVTMSPSDAPHYVICGLLEPPDDDQNGYKNQVAFPEYPANASENVDISRWINCRGFLVTVRIKAGDNGEFGKDFDFEFRWSDGGFDSDGNRNSFQFEYLSKKRRREQRKSTTEKMDALLRQAENIEKEFIPTYNGDLQRRMWSWGHAAEGFVVRSLGYEGLNRFETGKPPKKYYGKDGYASDFEDFQRAYVSFKRVRRAFVGSLFARAKRFLNV